MRLWGKKEERQSASPMAWCGSLSALKTSTTSWRISTSRSPRFEQFNSQAADPHNDPIREEEFERVAMPHASTLLRTALRLTSDSGYAEDLVQEVLLRAWRCFDQFEMGTNCKAWLFRIMFNLSSKRQLQIKAKPPGSLDENEFVQPSTVLTSSGFTQTEVLAALDSLAEEHRNVLMLGVVEGFTCKEMA